MSSISSAPFSMGDIGVLDCEADVEDDIWFKLFKKAGRHFE